MASVGTAFVDVKADFDGFNREIDDAGSGLVGKFGGFAKAAAKAFAVGAAAAGVGAAVFGRAAIDAASDYNETLSKSNTIFGEQGAAIEKWAATSAKAFGQSKQEALDAAGTFGNMFVQLGIGSDVAADMSTGMTELASDFASFHNAAPTDVIEAMTAAFRGEYDAVQRFVPTISAAAVEQEGLRLGLAKTTKELDAQDKAIAVQSLLMSGAGDAMGDFARTSGGLANQQRILSATFNDLKVTIGQALLPVMLRLVTFATGTLLPAIARLWPAVLEAAANIRDAVVGAFESMRRTLGPIVRTIRLGVLALVAAFRDPDVTSDGFVGVMERIGVKAREVFDTVLTFASMVVKWFQDRWPTIQRVGLEVFTALQNAWESYGRPVFDALVAAAAVAVQWVSDHWREIDDVVRVSAKAVKKAIGTVVDALTGVSNWVRSNRELVIAALSGLGAVAATAFGIWAVSQAIAFAGFIAGMAVVIATAVVAAAPFVAIGLAIAAVVGGLVYAYRNFETFRDIVQGVITVVTTVVSTFVDVVLGLWHRFGDDILTVIRGAWDGIRGVIDGALRTIKGVIDLFMGVFTGDWDRAWQGIKDIFGGIWDGISAYISGVVEIIKGTVGGLIDSVVLFFEDLPGKALEALGDLLTFLTQKGKDLVGGLLNGITDKAGDIIDWALRLPGNIIGWIGDIGAQMLEVGKDIIRGIIKGLAAIGSEIRDKIMEFVPSPGDIVGGIGGAVKSVGSALNPFDNATGGVYARTSIVRVAEVSGARPEIITPQALMASTFRDELERFRSKVGTSPVPNDLRSPMLDLPSATVGSGPMGRSTTVQVNVPAGHLLTTQDLMFELRAEELLRA